MKYPPEEIGSHLAQPELTVESPAGVKAQPHRTAKPLGQTLRDIYLGIEAYQAMNGGHDGMMMTAWRGVLCWCVVVWSEWLNETPVSMRCMATMQEKSEIVPQHDEPLSEALCYRCIVVCDRRAKRCEWVGSFWRVQRVQRLTEISMVRVDHTFFDFHLNFHLWWSGETNFLHMRLDPWLTPNRLLEP